MVYIHHMQIIMEDIRTCDFTQAIFNGPDLLRMHPEDQPTSRLGVWSRCSVQEEEYI